MLQCSFAESEKKSVGKSERKMVEKLGYNHRRMGLLYGNENRRWLQTHTGWRERESTNIVQLMSLILPQQLLQEIWMQHGDEHHWNWGTAEITVLSARDAICS